jgi:hypothetical protein
MKNKSNKLIIFQLKQTKTHFKNKNEKLYYIDSESNIFLLLFYT